VRVLPAWQSEPVALDAVRVHGDRVSRCLELLIESLQQRWRREPWVASAREQARENELTRFPRVRLAQSCKKRASNGNKRASPKPGALVPLVS
jgi:hypothetical protein